MSLEKVQLMTAAATLAGAVVSNRPDTLPLDIQVQNVEVRAENFFAWELHKIFYHGLVKAVADDTNYPPPAINPQNFSGGVIQGVLEALSGNPLLQQLAQQLLAGLLPTPQPIATVPDVPNPGDPLPGTGV